MLYLCVVNLLDLLGSAYVLSFRDDLAHNARYLLNLVFHAFLFHVDVRHEVPAHFCFPDILRDCRNAGIVEFGDDCISQLLDEHLVAYGYDFAGLRRLSTATTLGNICWTHSNIIMLELHQHMLAEISPLHLARELIYLDFDHFIDVFLVIYGQDLECHAALLIPELGYLLRILL